MKLTRTGSTITAFQSPDSVTWSRVGADTFVMGATVDVGLAVSSHVTGTLATAVFDNIAITAAAPNAAPSRHADESRPGKHRPGAGDPRGDGFR